MELARGVDVLFAPANEAMYPPGFRTRVVVEPMIPTELIGVEWVREADGLTMSSSNKYLNGDERRG